MTDKTTEKTLFGLIQVPDIAKNRPIAEMVRRTDCSPVDILQCFYGLTALEICTYLLIRREKLAVEEIAEKVHRKPSSVQRALKKLTELKLLQREKIPGDGSGYSYEYRAITAGELKEEIIGLAGEINTKVADMLSSTMWLENISNVLLKEIPKR
ncbi:MAG: helix-turn-helix domain-containing protein [Candidatus Odinarchaeota archaeon]